MVNPAAGGSNNRPSLTAFLAPAAAMDYTAMTHNVCRRWFAVVCPGLYIAATPGMPSLGALTAVETTHLVSWTEPDAALSSALHYLSLDYAVLSLYPNLNSHDAEANYGYDEWATPDESAPTAAAVTATTGASPARSHRGDDHSESAPDGENADEDGGENNGENAAADDEDDDAWLWDVYGVGDSEGGECAFAQALLDAVDFINVARNVTGVAVITSFTVGSVNMSVVLALVYVAKTFGVEPRVAMPMLLQTLSAALPPSALEKMNYALTIAIAERCLLLVAVPDCQPIAANSIYLPPAPLGGAQAAANSSATVAASGDHVPTDYHHPAPLPAPSSVTTSPSTAALSRAAHAVAPRTYQCLCGVHQWRLPSGAMTSNVVIDAASLSLVPSDTLPRWAFTAYITNMTRTHACSIVSRMFDSHTVHVATMSREAVAAIGVDALVPEGPTIRVYTDEDGQVVFCRECASMLVYIPATPEGSPTAASSFGAVLLCNIESTAPALGGREDQRRPSWSMLHAQAIQLAASFSAR